MGSHCMSTLSDENNVFYCLEHATWNFRYRLGSMFFGEFDIDASE